MDPVTIAALIGAAATLYSSHSAQKAIKGSRDKNKQITSQTPEQQEMMKLIHEGIKSGTGPFSDIFGKFNEEDFQKGITDPALKNFKENILPQIQEKFISGNQALGSGMQRGQLKAASDLQSQLAQLLYQAKQQQSQNRIGGIQSFLGQKPFETLHTPESPGVLQGIIQGAGKGIGKGLGDAASSMISNWGAQNNVVPTASQAVAG